MMLVPFLLVAGALEGGGGRGIGGGGDLSASGRLTSCRSDARLERPLDARGGGGGRGDSERPRRRRSGVENVRTGRVAGVSSSTLDKAGPARGDERSGLRIRLRL
ncbi:hypothetical protein DFH09DRAFT_1180103 [Mycena vulgaris]|nr:hypothetical protein DFH09DRAFT_1180103 [Mycena vulgaris]